jgi:hypothetical protein
MGLPNDRQTGRMPQTRRRAHVIPIAKMLRVGVRIRERKPREIDIWPAGGGKTKPGCGRS